MLFVGERLHEYFFENTLKALLHQRDFLTAMKRYDKNVHTIVMNAYNSTDFL